MAGEELFSLENIYYDGDAIGYPLGGRLHEKYSSGKWHGVEKNSVRNQYVSATDFFEVNRKNVYLTVQGRQRYNKGNRVYDFAVPFTSAVGSFSRSKGKCLYIYVNREEIMIRLLAEAAKNKDFWFEIGEFSDLVAENEITGNLPWIIEEFGKGDRGFITFSTSFALPSSIFSVHHKCRTVIRMKINPDEIIRSREPQTSPLRAGIHSVNKSAYADYPCGLVFAPISIAKNWKELYGELFDILEATLCEQVKNYGTIEMVFEKNASVTMAEKLEAAEFLIRQGMKKLPNMKIIDIR